MFRIMIEIMKLLIKMLEGNMTEERKKFAIEQLKKGIEDVGGRETVLEGVRKDLKDLGGKEKK